MIFSLPSLPYSYHALEPYIDARTIEVHYSKHHQAYINHANQALSGTTFLQTTERSILEALLKKISTCSTLVRNNVGGHFNHTFFWDSLTPHALSQPSDGLLSALAATFESFETFQDQFTARAMAHFGSGWAWLSVAKTDGRLMLSTTSNQDNPLMDCIPIAEQGYPILGLDIWEHAYYLLYQNRRLSYIGAFWKVVHWEVVERRFFEAIQLFTHPR